MANMIQKSVAAVAGLVALSVGGAAIAGASTSAKTATTTVTTTTTTAPATTPSFPAHGTSAHEDAEKPVTGDAAAKAQAAAVKAAGGGTAGAVTTDFQGSGYEVTVTKSDGTSTEYHLDSSFTVMVGGPGGHGGPGGPPPSGGTTTAGTFHLA